MAKAEDKSKLNANLAAKAGKGPLAGAEIADSGSVDKIRDILFGNQMRDFDRRFSLMEERLAKASQDLRDETLKRMEALELFFKKELDALKARLKSESDERSEGEKQLNNELKNASAVLKKAIAQVEENFSEQATEIRRQILDQSKSLAAEIQAKNEQAAAELSARTGALDETKINRSTMAEYLIEMAMRLSNHSGDPPAVDRNE
jgi:DNA anti-recombination protein RmuC